MTFVTRAAWRAQLRPSPARIPTSFEQRVYKVISAIPKGQTRSYRWVAEQLGDVNLARAVGNALGRNPYAPRVPCHRVIKTDGSLGGYTGGLAKKRELLRKEGWKSATKNARV